MLIKNYLVGEGGVLRRIGEGGIQIKCRIRENPDPDWLPAFKLNSFMSNLAHMLQSKEKFVATQEVDTD